MTDNMNSNVPNAPATEHSASQTVHSATYADVLKRSRAQDQDGVSGPEEALDQNLNSEISDGKSTETSACFDNFRDTCNNEESFESTCAERDDASCFETTGSLSLTDDLGVPADELEQGGERSVISELTEDQAMNESETPSENTSCLLPDENDRKRKWSSSSSSECSSYEEDEESEELMEIADSYPGALKWKLRTSNPDLPDTVTVLNAPYGGKVYLVGTAHFSLESQEDVAKTIRATQPDVVTVELCKSRVNILSLDEETILEESQNMNFEKIRAAIRQNGFMQGILYLLLLNMSAHLTKQLGMAPGGEFRRAFAEAKKVPGCIIHLGDRSIHITLQRALAILSWWQKLRIAWYMLTNKEPISKQEVEKCKQRDLLEETLAEMTGEFPELSRVFVEERDTYLAYSLHRAAVPAPSHVSSSGVVPTVVVGVVGIGHVPGIVEKWDKVSEKDVPPLLSIPEASMSSKIIRKVLRYSLYGLALYGCYRLVPGSVVKKPLNLLSIYLTGR